MNQIQGNLLKDLDNEDDPVMFAPETKEEILEYTNRLSTFQRSSLIIPQQNDQLLQQLGTIQLSKETIKILNETSNLFDKLLIQAQDLDSLFSTINETYRSKTTQITKLINIGKLQILQLIEIFFVEKSKQVYNDRNQLLDKFGVHLNNHLEINQNQIKTFLEFLNDKILQPLLENNEQFFKKDAKIKPRLLMLEVRIILSKLHTMLEIFPFVISHHQDDLFSLMNTDDQWGEINKYVQYKVLDTEENLQTSYDQILRGVLLGNAIVAKTGKYENEIVKGLAIGAGAIYYLLNQKEAKSQARIFQAEPQAKLAIQVWNMLDNGIAKQMLPILFPAIAYKEKIFIPRYFKKISLDYILNQYEQGYMNGIKKGECDFIESVLNNDLSKKPEMLDVKELFKQTNSEQRICIRMLCSQKIYKVKGNQTYGDFKTTHEQIIIHIHGGGFVSMSSRSHQTYTRKWANSLGIPIFSIDYRLSPQHPFPAALDDVWQAYLWIINFSQYYFNINPKKVILVGDSAGGNLVAALTVLAIKEKVRIPDGILMGYPALNLDRNCYTPSMLWSIEDAMLPHTYLKMCIESYVQCTELQPKLDPLISPSKASDEILDQFPPCRIQAGTNDPLHDDSWRLGQRLIKRGRNFHMTVYPGMPHAFYSFDTPQGMKASAITIMDASYYLKELLEGNHQC